MKPNEAMDQWQHDKPAYVDEEEKDLKHLLKTCKSIEELTEKLGYDPNRYEVVLDQTVSEKNLKSGIIILRDKMRYNTEMKKQYRKFLKEQKGEVTTEEEDTIPKFEFKPKEKKKHGRKKKKVKYPKCFAKEFGSYKCDGCSWNNLCEKRVEEDGARDN